MHAFEFCPARLFIESRSVNACGQKLRTSFDVKKLIFRELFKTNSNSSHVRLSKAQRLIDKYSRFLSGDELPAKLMAIHLLKTYEKLVNSLKFDSIEPSSQVPLKISDKVFALLTPDLVGISKTRTTFVILCSLEQWTQEDISNKFENYLIYKVLWPEMRQEDSRLSICYYCPDNGKSCILNHRLIGTFNHKVIKRRMMRVFKAIENKDYVKIPIGFKCQQCPVYDKCMPNGFSGSTFSEKVEVIEAPLFL